MLPSTRAGHRPKASGHDYSQAPLPVRSWALAQIEELQELRACLRPEDMVLRLLGCMPSRFCIVWCILVDVHEEVCLDEDLIVCTLDIRIRMMMGDEPADALNG